MDVVIITYASYIAISVALTVCVAQALFRHGRVFLVDVFSGNEGLADSVNYLLVVGFYLINLGYICLALRIGYEVVDARHGIEALSQKVGLVLVVLGGMHFLNLYVFSRIRSQAAMRNASPPVAPDRVVARPDADVTPDAGGACAG